ncbi:unnamed protein product [Caenorhabditis brenneri]
MFLETPDFISNVLHTITFLVTPLHVLGFYCILFKTPEAMKSVKWGMFHFQCWVMAMDLSLTVITVPFLLSPAAAGVPLGIAKLFGIRTDFQCYFALTAVAAMGLAIVLIFENRYFLMFARQSTWRYYRVILIFIAYSVILSIFIPLLYMVPEQTSARAEVLQLLPEITQSIDSNLIFVLTTDIRYVLCAASFLEVSLSILSFVFIGLLSSSFKVQFTKHSQKTLRMQKNFLRAIYIQASVMLFHFQLPIGYTIFSTVSKYHNQTLNNFSIIVLSLHGIASTIVMLWSHKPFRQTCFNWITCGRHKIPYHSHISVIRH